MTPTEVLSEIQKMPPAEQRQVVEELTDYLCGRKNGELSEAEIEAREDEFERKLLAEGFITNIPTRDETDEEFDSFEPLEFEGEPLSEMIIRERR
ncbi:MAG: hypothetical protein M3Q78_12095 [Acidobacteriota bacterium]|nr:hypothetical protein [Acidobacteriota bacterium]